MSQTIRRLSHGSIFKSIGATIRSVMITVILSAVSIIPSAFGQGLSAPGAPAVAPVPAPAAAPAVAPLAPATAATPATASVTPGIAIGDCSAAGQAMARTYTSETRPPNPAQKVCEGGRIQMQVQADRHFGNRIMDPVLVTVMLAVDPAVVLDLQSLSRGTLTFNGQEFDLVSPLALNSGQSPVRVQSRRLHDGRNLIKIDLIVQSSVPASVAPYLVFRLDLRYALGNIRDAEGNTTGAPDWRVLTTPVVGLTMSPTAVAGDSFRELEVEPVQQVRPWPTLALLVSGLILILLGPSVTIVRWINRVRPGRIVPANEIAWRVLDRTFAEGAQHGFSLGHFRAIASALRKYLNSSSATHAELRERFADDPRRKAILRVLSKCDRALFSAQQFTRDEIDELVEDVEQIVPRP